MLRCCNISHAALLQHLTRKCCMPCAGRALLDGYGVPSSAPSTLSAQCHDDGGTCLLQFLPVGKPARGACIHGAQCLSRACSVVSVAERRFAPAGFFVWPNDNDLMQRPGGKKYPATTHREFMNIKSKASFYTSSKVFLHGCMLSALHPPSLLPFSRRGIDLTVGRPCRATRPVSTATPRCTSPCSTSPSARRRSRLQPPECCAASAAINTLGYPTMIISHLQCILLGLLPVFHSLVCGEGPPLHWTKAALHKYDNFSPSAVRGPICGLSGRCFGECRGKHA